MSSRREARERTMQGLYALEMGGGSAEHVLKSILDDRLAEDKEARDFATTLFLRVLEHEEEADSIVVKYTQNWEFSRIALIDRILLRIGITELLAFDDVPPKVTINEVIEVAKGYSTAKSGQFINGILDTVFMDFQKEGRLNKRGRGLIGMEEHLRGE
jgi:N utilization substance protein B